MNEFLPQFLTESRELVEQATQDLLALEESPGDRERLDSAFRAFHTLKGAAGIMEFDAMSRALHAAEEILAATRDSRAAVSAGLISDALTCLDQVLQWLEVMEASGEPPADAGDAAEVLIRRFATEPAPEVAAATDWVDALIARHPGATGASVALRYTPASDAFFHGLDPLALFEGEPGLLALEIEPATPWPPLREFDPFAAQLAFRALLAGPSPAFLEALRAAGAEIVGLATEHPDLQPEAAKLLLAQVAMLKASRGDGAQGRAASAAKVAASVLRRVGRRREAERLDRLRTTGADPGAIQDAIAKVLAGTWEAPPGEDEARQALEVRPVPDAVARSLRVEVERVDALVDLTGELTVAKNAIAHTAALASDGADLEQVAQLMKAQTSELDRLVRELQRAVLNMRVLPLRHVFQRFPRLVREMVNSLGKPAHLVTEGEATEADKTIVENLFEPLLHVLRNALDHGVEDAERRAASGKPPSATITLRARSEGDLVVVEVEDDGGGVDVARVREIALERGVVSADALSTMNQEEVVALIFAPGFSTAQAVTSVSGRGVGMDAVRTSIERLGGRVSVLSRAGEGTTVRFTLPFTIMMSRLMTVEAGGQLFGIPMEAVLETVRMPRETIVPLGGARAFVLRDRTVPVIELNQALGRDAATGPRPDASVVVVSAGGRIGGLEVDRLGDRMDVMLKPLRGLLAGTPGVAGTTLLGDGRVLLVLDVKELLQ
jgi:two-component system chemotaxis sensor kinase CheA